MRTSDMIGRLEDHPFRPFRMHLSDGTKLDVLDRSLILVGVSSVVMATEFTTDEDGNRVAKRWRTIALSHIVQFTDLDDATGSKKKRRAG
ncbi:MAG: hypothetical protein WD042_17180 [Phycisphaeraceae bacterium]